MGSNEGAGGFNMRAVGMAVIAFLCQGLTYACMFGTFGVLLTTVESRLGVGRQMSSLAIPLVSISVAVIAPIAGSLASRISLRLLLIVGALMGAGGYTLLATTKSFPMYLIAYGLLIGPGLCLSGAVLPPTLVSRWFDAGRGRALGFVHMPVLMIVMPLICDRLLHAYGSATVYWLLTGIMLACVGPMLFVVDHPPKAVAAAPDAAETKAAAEGGVTIAQLVSSFTFWGVIAAVGSMLAGATVISYHMVPIVMLWGFTAAQGATLISLSAFAGMFGTVVLGWVADKIGGRMTLILGCFDSALLFGGFLLHPPFPVLAVIVGLLAFHSAGALPTMGMAMAESFGQASFGRAFGLGNLAILPFTALALPIAAAIYDHTGGYTGALIGEALLLALGMLLALAARARRRPQSQETAV